MSLQGKGMYLWKVADCEGGNPAAIAATARSAGLSHVLIKIANGIFPYNIQGQTQVDQAAPVVQSLRGAGVEPWGWHYVYGNDPVNEARIAIRRIRELNLAGYVINAEAEYKQPGKKNAARTFMNSLRSALPNLPIGLSSYRYPSYHTQLPWQEFLEKCDFNMPQVYWLHAHNPATQLQQSLRQFQSMSPFRTIVPTGAAFAEHGWKPSPGEVQQFMQAAQSLNLAAVNFWSWDNARSRLPEVWQVISEYDWAGGGPQADLTQQLVDAWNTRDPAQVIKLYQPLAVHVNASRTVSGQAAIKSWYQTLFNQVLVKASFTLTGFSGHGNSRHLTWTANSSSGRVLNGNDTLGLIDGKISYHFTFFTVS